MFGELISKEHGLTKFANKNFELFFSLYLLSGVIKGIFLANGGKQYIDFTLVTGGVLIGLCSILFFSQESVKPTFNKLGRIIFLFIFYAVALISLFYTPSEKYSLVKFALFLTNIIAIISPVFKPKFNTKRFIKIFSITAALIGLYSFVIYAFYFSNMGKLLGLEKAFFQSFYLEAGYLIGLAIILLLKLPYSIQKIMGLNLLLFLLWSSAARGPIIFTSICILIYLCALALDKGTRGFLNVFKRKWKLIFYITTFNFIVISLIYSTSFGSVVLNRTLYRFSVIVPTQIEQTILSAEDHANGGFGSDFSEEDLEPARSNISRIDHYFYSWNMINKSWKTQLFGYGFGSYGIIKTEKDIKLYPHNIFLEIWFETGLIGLTTFLIFIIQALLWTLKNNQQILGIAILYLFANTFKSYSLIDHRILMGIFGISVFVKAIHPAFKFAILGNSEE